jgi:hypothetical protein
MSMGARAIRMLTVAVLVGGAVTAVAGAASAAPGPGTFTKITTPTGTTIYKFNGASATNNLTVSGQASLDVTSVDIVCVFYSVSGIQAQHFAVAVTVTGGSFSTVVNLSPFPTNCRLRAIPNGVDPTSDYIGSYSGPILYANTIIVTKDASIPYKYLAAGEQGSGVGAIADAGQCAVQLIATIETPAMEVRGPGRQQCLFELPSGNLTVSGTATASSIKVDSKNAYLPTAVHDYLRNSLGLTLTQSTLTTTFTRYANGDVTVTESAPLMRCNGNNTYPPTGGLSGSCTSLVNTGVKFTRVANIFRGAHQIRMRDTFTSTNGQVHAIALQYQGAVGPPPTGSTGYTFPGGSTTFHKTSLDQVVTGLGTKAGSIFVRSDINAVSGDPAADTLGLTWSRAPSKVMFSHTSANLFAMPYSLSVPAGGKAYLGFAVSEAPLTSDAKTRAGVAVAEMVNTPSISSPANGAVIHGHTTTVKGTVTVGANGLPTSVIVNGHAAHFTSISSTSKTYSVTFDESYAKHKITVTAYDSAHNSRSRSITVTNVA